jgi:hypothetical protein
MPGENFRNFRTTERSGNGLGQKKQESIIQGKENNEEALQGRKENMQPGDTLSWPNSLNSAHRPGPVTVTVTVTG